MRAVDALPTPQSLGWSPATPPLAAALARPLIALKSPGGLPLRPAAVVSDLDLAGAWLHSGGHMLSEWCRLGVRREFRALERLVRLAADLLIQAEVLAQASVHIPGPLKATVPGILAALEGEASTLGALASDLARGEGYLVPILREDVVWNPQVAGELAGRAVAESRAVAALAAGGLERDGDSLLAWHQTLRRWRASVVLAGECGVKAVGPSEELVRRSEAAAAAAKLAGTLERMELTHEGAGELRRRFDPVWVSRRERLMESVRGSGLLGGSAVVE